jgi:tetratricopeptide (TPR) repeat protein
MMCMGRGRADRPTPHGWSLGRAVSLAAVSLSAASGAWACGPRRPAPGPVTSALIATAAEIGAAPAQLVAAWEELDRIAALVRTRQRRTGAPLIDDLTAVVFDDLGFTREIDDEDPKFYTLTSVLAARRGSCLGLGAVYLIVAERLGVALDGVRVPGHFFVRTREWPPRNIELLRRGEAMPDDWYRTKYGPWSADGAYFRPLAPKEVTALFWFNIGNFARRAGELERARQAYARAAAEAPTFSEAQASVGLVHQLTGAGAEAEDAYRAAVRAGPDLVGVGQNMALLRNGRAKGSGSTSSLSPPAPTATASPIH